MGAPPKLAQTVQAGCRSPTSRPRPGSPTTVAWDEQVGNSTVVLEPIGVVGAITPWNYPLHQVTAKVAYALAAGCTVVLKPSEVAPLCSYLFFDAIHEVGLPAGVVNLVPGYGSTVGEAIAAHPDVDMVSFTGSTRAGTRVAELGAATVKKVALELGGKSANVILPDADLAQRGEGRRRQLLHELRPDLHGVDPDAGQRRRSTTRRSSSPPRRPRRT